MSNQAKDWQNGAYIVLVEGKHIVVQKKVEAGKNSYGLPTFKIMTAHARCAPEDEFSLSTGVALAMDRLNKQLGEANDKTDKTIEVGDKVKIKDYSLSYTTYVNWIAKNVDSVKLAACYAYETIPEQDDTEYVVKTIAPWGDEDSPKLAYVQRYFVYHNGKISDSEPCFLMRIDGLEKVYE